MSARRTWGIGMLGATLLATGAAFAQFVEVTFTIEETSWGKSAEAPTVRRIVNARCVFGTNIWLLEGDFHPRSKNTYWCTGTNIIEHVLITAVPTKEERRRAVGPFFVAEIGDTSTNLHGRQAERPLSSSAYVSWLAFCSGSFLKSKGRTLTAPYGPPEGFFADKTRIFDDALGLPERVEMYRATGELACVYQVQQSTNFAGSSIPLRFEFTQMRLAQQPRWRASGVVTAIRIGAHAPVPPQFTKEIAR